MLMERRFDLILKTEELILEREKLILEQEKPIQEHEKPIQELEKVVKQFVWEQILDVWTLTSVEEKWMSVVEQQTHEVETQMSVEKKQMFVVSGILEQTSGVEELLLKWNLMMRNLQMLMLLWKRMKLMRG